jgi:RHS repeat-associated protein
MVSSLVAEPPRQRSRALDSSHAFSTQRERDEEFGGIQFRSRSYIPHLGRFIQRDPILANRVDEHYLYARLNPSRYRDPFGRDVREQMIDLGLEAAFELANDPEFLREAKKHQNNPGFFGTAVHERAARLGARKYGKTMSFEVEILKMKDGTYVYGNINHGRNSKTNFKWPEGAEIETRIDAVRWNPDVKPPKSGDIALPEHVLRDEDIFDWKTGANNPEQTKKIKKIFGRKLTNIRVPRLSNYAKGFIMGFVAGATGALAEIAEGAEFKRFVKAIQDVNPEEAKFQGQKLRDKIAGAGQPGVALFVFEPHVLNPTIAELNVIKSQEAKERTGGK